MKLKIKKIVFSCLLGLAMPMLAAAGVENYTAASTADAFFTLPDGVRPAGLGNAFAGAVGDINALFCNPAGLARLDDRRAMVAHHSWIQQIQFQDVLYAQPVEGFGALGAGLHYVNFGAIDRWTMDSSGNPIPMGGTYTPFALVGIVAFAIPVGHDVFAGANVKLAYERIDASESMSGAVDAGLSYQIMPDWSVGAVIQNVGAAAGDFNLPINLRLGSAYNFPYSISEKDLFTIYSDVDLRRDDRPALCLGLEYTYIGLFQIRAGWNQDFGHTIDNRLGLTLGAGITFLHWALDYAFAPQGDLGASHKVSLQYGF